MTILSKLVAKRNDNGYIIYVFKCLDEQIIRQTPYVMCTRFPNWNHREIEIGEVGYLEFMEIKAGEDTWFDGANQIPYRYNMIQFLRFIEQQEDETIENNRYIV